MTSGPLFVFGVLLFVSPGIMAIMDGCREEGDIDPWLMSKPLEFIITMNNLFLSGFGFIIAAAALSYAGGT